MITKIHKIKRAETKHDVADFIKDRWSPRSFSTQPIEEEILNTLFEAASWSASSGNAQPWVFIYAHRGSPEFDTMLASINPSNQVWAVNAAVLILSIVNKITPSGKANRFAMHDLGMANATMLLQANTLKIFGRMMGGYDVERVREEYAIPPTHEPASITALGYLGSLEGQDEQFIEREMKARARKKMEEFVFTKSPFKN